MSAKYSIYVPDDCAAELWATLTQTFNVILTKRQYSVDGEIVNIELKILNTKTE